MPRLFIIEDDDIMAECITRAVTTDSSYEICHFRDALAALDALAGALPDLIILDILLIGPDGFSLLNELSTYHDTARIPVIIVSSLDFHSRDLSHYHVAATLRKETMTPTDIARAVRAALAEEQIAHTAEPRHA